MSESDLNPYVCLKRISGWETPPSKNPRLETLTPSKITSCVMTNSPTSTCSEFETPTRRRSQRRSQSRAMLISNGATSDGEELLLTPLQDSPSRNSPASSPLVSMSGWQTKFRKAMTEIAWEDANRVHFQTSGFYGKKVQKHTPSVSRTLLMTGGEDSESKPTIETAATVKTKKVAMKRSKKQRIVPKVTVGKGLRKTTKGKRSKPREWHFNPTDLKGTEVPANAKTSPERKKKFFSSLPKSPSRRPISKMMIGHHRVHVLPAKVTRTETSSSSPLAMRNGNTRNSNQEQETNIADDKVAEINVDDDDVANISKVVTNEKNDKADSRSNAPSKWSFLNGQSNAKRTDKPTKSLAKAAFKRLRSTKTKDSNMQQLVIDAGQKEVAAVQCEECRMLYVPCDDDDNQMHVFYHNSIYVKLRFPGWKKEDVVQHYRDGRVICIRPKSPKFALQKALLVKQVVDDDLGSAADDEAASDSFTYYLFVSDEKLVVGCLVAESASKAFPIIPNQNVSCCDNTPVPVKCGVNRLWTLKSHRRQKIASHLMDCLRSSFIYGHVLGIDEIAFSSPSPAGQLFATKYTGPHFLVYK